ncbi:DUF2279 domain-containing protein [Roseivirga sp. BDSF3-8]|uniref:DUF2279 domain-containing protein n=1 Tax=Roseivirga sp. BDSF3-8 TaxID=3241598 RepID=UPI00353190EF
MASALPSRSQPVAETDTLRRGSEAMLLAAGVGYTATMGYLSASWYDGETTSFHFFNDNPQWKQMDKAGHFYAGYVFSHGLYQIWPSRAGDKTALYASLTGFLILVPIEVLDGFSPDYGASVGDLLADAGGALFFYGQQRGWGEQRMVPKFSFTRSGLAPLRPGVLGEGPGEEWLKDYNGQTYWVSFDIAKLAGDSGWPGWLTVDAGYGAGGMVYARDRENRAAGYESYRQYYLSPGINFRYWKGDSKVLNTLLYLADLIKIPAPALELNSVEGAKFHFLFF